MSFYMRKIGSRSESLLPICTLRQPEAAVSGIRVPAASAAPSEVVYFPDRGEMTENQIEKRLQPLRSDILELKDNVAKLAGQPAATGANTQPVSDNFVKRNSYWLWPMISLVFGTPIVGFVLGAVVDRRIDLKLTDPLKQIGEQAKSLAVLDAKQSGNSDLLKIVLQKEMSRTRVLSPTEFKQELPQLNEILNAAQAGKTPPPPGLFADLDNKLKPFIKQRDSEAWNAAISLAEYHSIFNSDPRGDFAVAPVVNGQAGKVIYHLAGPVPPGDKNPQMNSSFTSAPKDVGAHLQPIGQDVNPARTTTNSWVILTGGGLVLDGNDIKNAVLIGVHVVYNGGPVEMKNVTFINCRFTIQQTDRGQAFASIVTNSERVNFPIG
jgi:hypothetical protein